MCLSTVVLRMVSGGRLRTVMAAYQLERTANYVVLYVPVGSEGVTRSGQLGGPRGRLLLPTGWDEGFVPHPWRGQDVVMVHRFSEQWSTWRWLTEQGTWRGGSYINIERRWLVGDDMFDTEDLTLDLVITGNGDVTSKDEDELDWLEGIGVYSRGEASQIRAVGQDAYRHFTGGGWPLKADWSSWLPTPQVEPPVLPDRWQLEPAVRP